MCELGEKSRQQGASHGEKPTHGRVALCQQGRPRMHFQIIRWRRRDSSVGLVGFDAPIGDQSPTKQIVLQLSLRWPSHGP